MSDIRALIEAVEADTATGGRDALFVPADMSKLIERVIGDDDEMWATFVAAHDGSIDDAVTVVMHLLPGWGWDASSTGYAIVKESAYSWGSSATSADNPARALLLATLRAKLEGE
jgi:hypothetical protein